MTLQRLVGTGLDSDATGRLGQGKGGDAKSNARRRGIVGEEDQTDPIVCGGEDTIAHAIRGGHFGNVRQRFLP